MVFDSKLCPRSVSSPGPMTVSWTTPSSTTGLSCRSSLASTTPWTSSAALTLVLAIRSALQWVWPTGVTWIGFAIGEPTPLRATEKCNSWRLACMEAVQSLFPAEMRLDNFIIAIWSLYEQLWHENVSLKCSVLQISSYESWIWSLLFFLVIGKVYQHFYNKFGRHFYKRKSPLALPHDQWDLQGRYAIPISPNDDECWVANTE